MTSEERWALIQSTHRLINKLEKNYGKLNIGSYDFDTLRLEIIGAMKSANILEMFKESSPDIQEEIIKRLKER